MMKKTSNIISGTKIAKEITNELKERVQSGFERYKCSPGLAVILVGTRKDSETYVQMKQRKAVEIGINCSLIRYPDTIQEDKLVKKIETLNIDPLTHGIIVQLPLPSHIDKTRVLETVSVEKDVDGFRAANIGKLALEGHTPPFMPCTPRGVMELIKRYDIELQGKHVAMLGKSNIVGLPLTLALMKQNATVTVCNQYTINEPHLVRQADVVITAVGKPGLVTKEWVKPGAVVIDIGINAVADLSKKKGYRLVGDVAYDEVSRLASLITPVPGGVGPMTVAMLMQATVESFERQTRQ